MTVSAQAVIAGPFTGNGATVAFPFTMEGLAADEVIVLVDEVEVSSSLYSVTLATSGGTVTFTTAPASDVSVLILAAPSFEQGLALQNNGPFLPAAIESAFDRGVARDLWLKARIDKLLPANALYPGAGAGKFSAFDAAGLPVFSSGTGADAGLREDLADEDAGSALIADKLPDAGAVALTQAEINRFTIFANKFGAVGDGNTSTERREANRDAINAAILSAALNGGGVVKMGAADGDYAVVGPIYTVTGVILDLCGQRLRGPGPTTGTMFVTGTVEAGVLTHNAAAPPLTKIVRFASVCNGYISNVGLVFDFVSFEYGCSLENIATENCNRVFRLENCFYSKHINISARGFSDVSHPTYHFAGANNAIVCIGVSGVTDYTFLFENGTTACALVGCTSEGGTTGLKLKDDCSGLAITGCYFEAVLTALDLTEAGDCRIEVGGNYFASCDVVLDDGASTDSSRPLFGKWALSNFISTPDSSPHRSLMRVSGAFNLIEFELPADNNASTTVPTNWSTSATSLISFASGRAVGATDIRARNIVTAGIIPRHCSGDVGTPEVGTVPFATVTYPTGGSVTLLIDTKYAWQPDALFTKFTFKVTDDNGSFKVWGDTSGDRINQTAVNLTGSSPTTTVAISNNGGFLRYSIAGLINAAGIRSCTGRVGLAA